MTRAQDEQLTVASALRSLWLPVYLPTFLFSVGQGAVLPVIALAARDLGASIPVAGFIFALSGMAVLLFDLPAGSAVSRVGERRAMVVSTVVLAVALVGCALTSSLVIFAACVFVLGCGWSVWQLARMTYVANVMPTRLRGRALSTLGGVGRVGAFVGPLLAAGAMGLFDVDGAFYVHLVAAVAALGALVSVNDPGHTLVAGATAPTQLRGLMRAHRSTWLTGGVAMMAIGMLRNSRAVVIPLWGQSIGLDAAQISLIFAASSAFDMVLFYPAGSVMDRWGRKFAAVPCAGLLSVGFLLIPVTRGFASLTAVGLLIGLGNGLGSGIVMTLGSDFSPAAGRAVFFGIWRLLSDVGQTGGPLLVAFAGGVASVGAAAVTVGVLGLAGTLFIARVLPETLTSRTVGGRTSNAPP